jgi:lipopolysaccharide export system protein LptA
MTPRLALLSAAILIATGATGLHAQQRHDSNAPLDWEADRIEVQDNAHRAVLAGNVRMVQQEMTMTADRVVALYTGSFSGGQGGGGGGDAGAGGNPKIQRVDATGNVVVRRPDETAKGKYGIYDLNAKLITLIGDVSLDRNGSVVRGGRLVIDQTTNRATVDGSAVGGAGPAGKGGRVSGRFIVDQSGSSAPAQPRKQPGPK